MKYRKIGGLDISALGFGCMRLPCIDGDMSRIDEPEATKMIRYAIDHGVNYVDTAWPYHHGESEPFTGRALQGGYREKVHLATKLPSWSIQKHEDCDSYLDRQLTRLQTDHIDFYLLHALNEGLWKKLLEVKIFDFIERALSDGRIRHIGFSYHELYETFPKIIDSWHWDFCQIQFNYMDENFQAGRKGLEYAASKDIHVIAMEPLRGGKLTKRLPDKAQKLMDDAGMTATPAELAFKWVWNNPEISCVLSGMSAMEHVVENCRIADESEPGCLGSKEAEIVTGIRDILLEKTVAPCTNCRYCLPCPEGVAIPEILSIYNDLHIYGDEKWAKMYYRMAVKPENSADKCVECGECEGKCPQDIAIIETLKKAHTALKMEDK